MTVLDEVLKERHRQDHKWGVQTHTPDRWSVILGEEVGEVNRAILEGDRENYREELIQVAAVAVAAVECLDRAHGDDGDSDIQVPVLGVCSLDSDTVESRDST